MKRLSVFLTGAFLAIAIGTNAQNIDFRATTWGMTKADVKKAEKTDLVKEEDTRLIYETKITNLPARVIYTFSFAGKLMRGKYYIYPDYYTASFYVDDYKMIADALTQKYGAPVEKPTVKEDDWISAIANGLFGIETVWKQKRMDVTLTLSESPEGKIVIQIDYVSKEFTNVDTKEKRDSLIKSL
ncbi:MAG: hypothetical protein KKA07_17545 [Bacteroidetes bacterium]|nr:hypothetical protein [Bacteroidota bacterium]MBU1720875.1 hypothetical protein [Bacteroidota bacterium]